MQRRFLFLMGLTVLTLTGTAQAVTCAHNLPASNPDAAYTANLAKGTVTDTRTGLMWKTCVEGLSGATCGTGTPSRYTWDEALAHAEAATFAGYRDWRLPNINELRSLVEECRVGPAINDQRFPNTPSSDVWSGSPSAYFSYIAWDVYFGYGYAYYNGRSYDYHVRLVRGGQSFVPLSAQPLIDSLGKLRTTLLAKVDGDLEVVARGFGDSKNLQRSLVWSDWFGTALDLVTGTLSTIATALDLVDTAKSTLANGFVTAKTPLKAMTWLHTAHSLYQDLDEDGEKLQLALDGPAYGSAVKDMLQTAYDDACVVLASVCVDFDQAVYETAIKNRLNDAATGLVVTLHQSGDVQRTKRAGQRGVLNAKRKIAARLQATIDALKQQGTVPADFPMDATLTMLKRVREQVGASRSQGAVVSYDAWLDDGGAPVRHPENVSLGRIGDLERLRGVALSHFADDTKIQMQATLNTVQDSIVTATTLAVSQKYTLPDGVEIAMVAQGTLTTVLDIQLDNQRSSTSLGSRKVIDYAPEQMLTSLGEELSDLWMIADDLSNRILLDAR